MFFKCDLLPIKLSSTKRYCRASRLHKYDPAQDDPVGFFNRGIWPNKAVTLQKSQLNGQPLENCKLMDAYRFMFNSPHKGTGCHQDYRIRRPGIFFTRPLSRSDKNSGRVSSASSSTRWSTSMNASGSQVNKRPAGHNLDIQRLAAIDDLPGGCACTAMPPINTRSAQTISLSLRRSTFGYPSGVCPSFQAPGPPR